ncbi:MAG: ATP-dependent DNA helicase Rep [Lentisphaerae bacterium]|nr:ATP-dependent DNA helicase Rep [Lentisphaerota bacterium]
MDSEKIIAGLNPEQAEAVKTLNGPVLVLAGAGTGKTRVITCRIAYMLSKGIMPENILGLTFTNKAAAEMRERLASMVDPNQAKKVTLGTFHSFCIKLLRRKITKLGYLPSFTIADESDQQGIFKQACGALGFSSNNFPIGGAFSRISNWKNHLIDPLQAQRESVSDFDTKTARIYEHYQELLEQQNMVDFDDMLLLVYQLFRDFPEILKEYQERYRYLLVDEYQDTNTAQFVIIKMIAGEKPNLCVVGDDDQSIYSWRGAEVSNILDFPRIFEGTKTIKLEQNYRSCSMILDAANAVLDSGDSRRHRKRLWSALGEGKKPQVLALEDSEGEADFVSSAIFKIKNDNPELRYQDFAVLYRSNALSRAYELNFRRTGIPYRVVGGQQFFARREIKDAIAYLMLAINPRADQSLLRVIGTPPRGFGETALTALKKERAATQESMLDLLGNEAFLKKISNTAAKGAGTFYECVKKAGEQLAQPDCQLSAVISTYLHDVGYLDGLQKIYKDAKDVEKRLENLDEFLNDAGEFQVRNPGCTISDYLEKLRLDESNAEDRDEEHDAVTLSSIHASKGLEYGIVFLGGMEHDIFPHYRALEENSLDEELRLFYVAITRAKRELYISRAKRRMVRGTFQSSRPSPFLERLGDAADRTEPEEIIKPMDADQAAEMFAKAYEQLFGKDI